MAINTRTTSYAYIGDTVEVTAGCTATLYASGPRRRRTECDGTVSYEISFDAAGNRPDFLRARSGVA